MYFVKSSSIYNIYNYFAIAYTIRLFNNGIPAYKSTNGCLQNIQPAVHKSNGKNYKAKRKREQIEKIVYCIRLGCPSLWSSHE